MKWDALEPGRNSCNWAAADRLVSHAAAHGQGVRGHTLVRYAQRPSWLKNGAFSASELNTLLKKHIDTTVGRYKGKVYAWDVVNEAFTACENRLGVPRCAGITLWGVTDKYASVPGTFSGYGAALPYNESYAAEPAYTGLSNGINPNA